MRACDDRPQKPNLLPDERAEAYIFCVAPVDTGSVVLRTRDTLAIKGQDPPGCEIYTQTHLRQKARRVRIS
jgi:hypothetical protein